jgi:hypothetical protein
MRTIGTHTLPLFVFVEHVVLMCLNRDTDMRRGVTVTSFFDTCIGVVKSFPHVAPCADVC